MSYAYRILGQWHLILCKLDGQPIKSFPVERYIDAENMAKSLQVHFVQTDGKEVLNG